MPIVNIRCDECGATMQINQDNNVLQCPFCKSTKLIIESDEVKTTRIKEEYSIRKKLVENESEMAQTKLYFKILILVSCFLMAVFILMALLDKYDIL